MAIEERYKTGDTPWDIGKPDFNLVETVAQQPIQSCRVLDIGCGTGDNSIWLARNNFHVVGTDTSDIAIERAKMKASGADVICDFRVVNFLTDEIEDTPFGFIFDRGCFHLIDSIDDRKRFVRNVASHLEGKGLWLTIAGNADEHRMIPGPPQRTAADIVLAVEECFEVLSLTSSRFGSNHPNPPRAWRCLMQRRGSR
ncbi:MAG: class I SAM-dependent methyltransferase [Spirochaetes bacterium]|nr:class I SAM-dependent methyltransferase [Spirochaetota bacterium]